MTATLDRTTTAPKRVLMVVADPTTSTTTGWPSGRKVAVPVIEALGV
jgi:hypothetical protein